MANINEVLAKAKELHWGIKSLLRLSTFNEYDDLSSLDINYKDAEQLFLLDELRSIMDKLSDVDSKLSYLSLPIKETSRLHRNENGKFETKGGHYYSCGYGIEALVQDDCHEAPYLKKFYTHCFVLMHMRKVLRFHLQHCNLRESFRGGSSEA